jgi:hypothetical protein
MSMARNEWLTPIILATREAEIRRIKVQGPVGQIVHNTLSQKCPTQNQGWQSDSSGRASACMRPSSNLSWKKKGMPMCSWELLHYQLQKQPHICTKNRKKQIFKEKRMKWMRKVKQLRKSSPAGHLVPGYNPIQSSWEDKYILYIY